MLLLTITPFGWTFIAALVLTVFLTKGVVKRLLPGENPGCSSYGYVGLVLGCMMTLVLTFSVMLTETVYGFFVKPQYKARIIAVSSHMQEHDHKYTLMYTPTVEFTDNDGHPVTLETDISSGDQPVIGSYVTIVYAAGDTAAHELSFRSIALLGGGFLMLFILGLVLLAAVLYALGKNMQRLKNFALGFLMKFIFPFCMLFFLCAMGYALYSYFTGNKPDMPVWAVIVCLFFCLVLSVALPGYLKMVFKKMPATGS